jgi:hypothetical protein
MTDCCAATGASKRGPLRLNRIAARRPDGRSARKADIGAPTPCAINGCEQLQQDAFTEFLVDHLVRSGREARAGMLTLSILAVLR